VASVLIVDDYLETLAMLSATLRSTGFEVATAATGQGGIELALDRSFDVHLLDQRLPDISGVDVAQHLKFSRVSGRIVIMTAFPALDSAFDGGATGVDGFVDGPLWDMEVVEVVVQALNGPYPVRHPARQARAMDESIRSPGRVLSPLVGSLKQMIDSELDNAPSVSQLAARAQCSESTASHRFHAEVGVTISEYRRERRLQRAAQFLVTSHLSIRQIAYSVGYRSVSLADFRRDFRKRFEMSPKEYRPRFWRGPTAPR
jgi:AraC-like DNA-binding protein/ActR/RegA family two-component response regulator